MDKQNVVLTGFMGTGKTVTGRMLAGRLKLPFIDTDKEVEESMGLTPDEIFRRHGERRFRCEERLAVARAAGHEGCVIATGGGAVLDPVNMERLRRSGVIVLLEARPEVIAGRLCGYEDRPLLHCGDGEQEQLQTKQERLLAKQEQLQSKQEQLFAKQEQLQSKQEQLQAKQEQLQARIEELMRQRAPYYNDHDFRVDTSESGPDGVVSEILEYLRSRGWQIDGGKTAPEGQLDDR